ncbi:MAG: hypothetical protein ABI488_15975 [Polyangiaceae bacterium]
MKRPVVTALLFCAAAALAGCPVYDHEDAGCYRNSDCASGYVCDDSSGECYQPSSPTDGNSCNKPSDCGVNETCNKAAECVSGDCTFSGCINGFTCDSSSGKWQCISDTAGTAGEGGAAGTAGEGGAAGAPAAGAGGEAQASAGQAGASL